MTTTATPAGVISIHNESLYHDVMGQSATTYMPKKHTVTLRSGTQSNKQSLKQLQAKKRESKRKKIQKYHGEIEKWRRDNLKQTLQRMEFKRNREESEFRNQLNLIETRGGVYSEVAEILYKHESQHMAKSQHLYTDWQSHVFNPIQQHIESKTNDQQYMTRKKDKMRNLYEKYLTQCNKNGNKIFLDSINVKEYDPFEWTHDTEMKQIQKQNIKRKKRKLQLIDPLKSDLNKLIKEQKISQTTQYSNSQTSTSSNELLSDSMRRSRSSFVSTHNRNPGFSLKPHTRYCVSPLQYNHVSHLPLFRDLKCLEKAKMKCLLPSHVPGGNVLLNQHEVPKLDPKLLNKEYFPQTKRIVRPEFTKYEFKLSEMW